MCQANLASQKPHAGRPSGGRAPSTFRSLGWPMRACTCACALAGPKRPPNRPRTAPLLAGAGRASTRRRPLMSGYRRLRLRQERGQRGARGRSHGEGGGRLLRFVGPKGAAMAGRRASCLVRIELQAGLRVVARRLDPKRQFCSLISYFRPPGSSSGGGGRAGWLAGGSVRRRRRASLCFDRQPSMWPPLFGAGGSRRSMKASAPTLSARAGRQFVDCLMGERASWPLVGQYCVRSSPLPAEAAWSETLGPQLINGHSSPWPAPCKCERAH